MPEVPTFKELGYDAEFYIWSACSRRPRLRPVYPRASVGELREVLDGPLPDGPSDPLQVIEQLAADVDPGVVASQSGRYFGFVVGGSLPVALAADWLVSTWDQNLGLVALGPSAVVVENTAGAWTKELLGIPEDASFAFVTGCQTAHFTCLAAARQHVLAAAGWDLLEHGLAGSPPITVLVGAMRHSTVDRALRYLGIGRAQIRVVDAHRGRTIDPDALRVALAETDGPTIVCAQAGEVNTGVCDDLTAVADAVEGTGAWLHVDGAFGLWAAAAPSLRHLVAGHERADSWATDAHKLAQRPVRLRDRVLRASRSAPGGDDGARDVLHPRRRRDAGTHRLDARALASRPSGSGLRRPSAARPFRRGRPRRALLCARPTTRRRAGRSSRDARS